LPQLLRSRLLSDFSISVAYPAFSSSSGRRGANYRAHMNELNCWFHYETLARSV